LDRITGFSGLELNGGFAAVDEIMFNPANPV
jgi:hypothetical protein